MGNNNSGHAAVSETPALWTQSLPRDAHRNKKYGALQGTKVLPERIPGQRLKPTANGRNLQAQGTISTRKLTEVSSPSPGYSSPAISHHSSMTALNQSPDENGPYFPPSATNHHIRFGPLPSKSFTSEPDLRGSSPTSHMSLPTSNSPPKVVCESPTKGKIKSKKRYKAPLPPSPLQASISYPLERTEYVPSPNMSFENQSSISSPALKNSKSKPKKIGLFRKKNESRMSNYENEAERIDNKQDDMSRIEGRAKQRERSTTPVPIQVSSKKELKERARSLDNLQHEIRRSPQGLTSSLHSLEVIGNGDEDHWQQIPHDNPPKYGSPSDRSNYDSDVTPRTEFRNVLEKKLSASIDKEGRNHRRLSTVERRLYEKQLSGRRSEEIISSPVGDPKRFDQYGSRSSVDNRRSSSSSSSYRDSHPKEEVKDEWDLAEEEWLEKKRKSEIIHREIMSAAKNLRKTPVSSHKENVDTKVVKKISTIQITSQSEKELENDEGPKTFFFGMAPQEGPKRDEISPNKSALAKLNDQEDVKIVGSTVEYSRHSLKPKEKKRNLERDNWNRSLDYREKSRSRSKSRDPDENIPKSDVKKKLSRELDEFVETIERQKLKQKASDELSNSLSRKGDGGYHSRQNSGSFHLETEGSDDDNMIRMNLRPTLPRRQLELPRFSPNAAWRSLSVETSSRQKEVHSDTTTNDDVFSVSEDQIHRYTRPTAPPRTSGEKSADSGISGDAGSPGPIQEFEPLTPDKIKITPGPLAVSSPVTSTRLDMKRAWTPAQDLDDNSFEENVDHHGKSSFREEVSSTMPKLTSRTNMFSKPPMIFSPQKNIDYKHSYKEFDAPFLDDAPIKQTIEDYHINSKSLQREKIVTSASKNYAREKLNFDTPNHESEDNWRENWSMSRSIPNSLNTFDEPDGVDTPNKSGRSTAEPKISPSHYSQETRKQNAKIGYPSYTKLGTNGHIMYLPEYKSVQVNKEESRRRRSESPGPHAGVKYITSYDEFLASQGNENKSPSRGESTGDLREDIWNNHANPETTPKGNRFIVLNGKRNNKKFSYQSTVRMMEKKKLEEKLAREVEEKERRRLREVEAMMKVEQEFQLKREREKKKLKKQLQIFQEEQSHQLPDHSKPTFMHSNLTHTNGNNDYGLHGHETPPPLPSSPPPPFGGHRQLTSYQSLPMDFPNDSSFENGNGIPQQEEQPGLFSGFKKWVKGKKESRSGYHSDASSITVTSGSRQDPDGAPASSAGRKNVENIRAEIIAASRHRDGNVIVERESGSGRYGNQSPAPSVVSKDSHLRTITPDSKRAVSPDSRKSISSETCQLTRELPEMRQEHRQYREYRRSSRKPVLPSASSHQKSNARASPVTHNYRRDFCLGNVANSHSKLYPDLYTRQPSETRKQRRVNPKRSSSAELIVDVDSHSNSSLQRRYSSSKVTKHSVPIPIPPPHSHGHGNNRMSSSHVTKGYGSPHLTPYPPGKGYHRPVNFSPPPGKILTVT